VLLGAIAIAYVLAAGSIILAVAASGGSAFSIGILLDILRIMGLLPQKKKKGYVYSTINKDPVSLALIDIKDPTNNRYLGTMITGFDGAYYEPYLDPGEYLFKAKESTHRFPTMKQRPAGLA